MTEARERGETGSHKSEPEIDTARQRPQKKGLWQRAAGKTQMRTGAPMEAQSPCSRVGPEVVVDCRRDRKAVRLLARTVHCIRPGAAAAVGRVACRRANPY